MSGWCFLGSWFFSLCTWFRWCHFLWSVVELAIAPVFVAVSSAFPGPLGPPPFWRVSCLYCCRARLTASSTNRRLTLRSSASSGSDRRHPPGRKHHILMRTLTMTFMANNCMNGCNRLSFSFHTWEWKTITLPNQGKKQRVHQRDRNKWARTRAHSFVSVTL